MRGNRGLEDDLDGRNMTASTMIAITTIVESID
jgi:hypothetical protein